MSRYRKICTKSHILMMNYFRVGPDPACIPGGTCCIPSRTLLKIENLPIIIKPTAKTLVGRPRQPSKAGAGGLG
jgi:hypothetical protein